MPSNYWEKRSPLPKASQRHHKGQRMRGPASGVAGGARFVVGFEWITVASHCLRLPRDYDMAPSGVAYPLRFWQRVGPSALLCLND